MSKYDDIIGLNRPVSNRTKMSIENRAAQFAPFSALTGYNEAIAETARTTDIKRELAEGMKEIINEKLNYISTGIGKKEKVTITYFVKDKKKSGGEYVKIKGLVKRVDNILRVIYMENGLMISFDAILDISSDMFDYYDL